MGAEEEVMSGRRGGGVQAQRRRLRVDVEKEACGYGRKRLRVGVKEEAESGHREGGLRIRRRMPYVGAAGGGKGWATISQSVATMLYWGQRQLMGKRHIVNS